MTRPIAFLALLVAGVICWLRWSPEPVEDADLDEYDDVPEYAETQPDPRLTPDGWWKVDVTRVGYGSTSNRCFLCRGNHSADACPNGTYTLTN